jgi:hypothetical protein
VIPGRESFFAGTDSVPVPGSAAQYRLKKRRVIGNNKQIFVGADEKNRPVIQAELKTGISASLHVVKARHPDPSGQHREEAQKRRNDPGVPNGKELAGRQYSGFKFSPGGQTYPSAFRKPGISYLVQYGHERREFRQRHDVWQGFVL